MLNLTGLQAASQNMTDPGKILISPTPQLQVGDGAAMQSRQELYVHSKDDVSSRHNAGNDVRLSHETLSHGNEATPK